MSIDILSALEITTRATKKYVDEQVASITDADTLDGKHADEFALSGDFTKLQAQVGGISSDTENLKTLVGGISVSEQITKATEQFVVNVNHSEDGQYSADKTFAEVFAAGYDAIVVLHYENGNSIIFHVHWIDEASVCFQADILGATSAYMVIHNDETVELSEIRHGGLPAVTTSDNGAFLRVVNGTWSKSKMINAEEVAF